MIHGAEKQLKSRLSRVWSSPVCQLICQSENLLDRTYIITWDVISVLAGSFYKQSTALHFRFNDTQDNTTLFCPG